MMARYRVFVSFFFCQVLQSLTTKWAKSKQRSQSPNSCLCKVKIYSPRRVRRYLSPGNSIILEIAATLLFICVPIFHWFWGSVLLKLKHASNRPVNPSCLQSNTKKHLPCHISTLSSETQYTTWYYNSQRQKIPQNPFPATTYLLLEGKTSSYFIACVKTRNSIVSNYHVLQVNTAHFDFVSTGDRLLSKSSTRRFWDSCLVYPTDFPLLSSIRVYFV